MTPKGHGVIRGRRDLLFDPKGQLDLWPWPWPRLWPQKVTGWSEVAMTYFMTPKVNLTFDLDLDPKVKHLTWQVTTYGSGSVILLRPKMGLVPPKHDVISMPTQQYTNTKHIPMERVSSCSFHYAELYELKKSIRWKIVLPRSENRQNFWGWLTVLFSQMRQPSVMIPTISGVSEWSIFHS